jgi:hypothetical protein
VFSGFQHTQCSCFEWLDSSLEDAINIKTLTLKTQLAEARERILLMRNELDATKEMEMQAINNSHAIQLHALQLSIDSLTANAMNRSGHLNLPTHPMV